VTGPDAHRNATFCCSHNPELAWNE
jgi:hypothetical protein